MFLFIEFILICISVISIISIIEITIQFVTDKMDSNFNSKRPWTNRHVWRVEWRSLKEFLKYNRDGECLLPSLLIDGKPVFTRARRKDGYIDLLVFTEGKFYYPLTSIQESKIKDPYKWVLEQFKLYDEVK